MNSDSEYLVIIVGNTVTSSVRCNRKSTADEIAEFIRTVSIFDTSVFHDPPLIGQGYHYGLGAGGAK